MRARAVLTAATLTAAMLGVGIPKASATTASGVTVSLSDGSVYEGHDHTRSIRLTISLNRPASSSVGVAVKLYRETPKGETFITTTNTGFAAGAVYSQIAIPVHGNDKVQPDRQFKAEISAITGPATIARGQGSAIAYDDDPTPSSPGPILTIGPAAAAEGDEQGTVSGTQRQQSLVMNVTLDRPAAQQTLISFHTEDGTGAAGIDYVGRPAGQVTIPIGNLTGIIRVPLIPNITPQADRTVQVVIDSVSDPNVTIGHGTATGTILDDD